MTSNMSATIDGKTYSIGDKVYIEYNDKGIFLAQIHAINMSKQTIKVRWRKGTYTVYEFSEVDDLFYDVNHVLKPVTLDEYFDDISEIAKCVPGFHEREAWTKTKMEDIMLLNDDGIEWRFTCSDNVDDFGLYTTFKY